jgi:hypothetical protein
MKNFLICLLAATCILTSCNKESGSITGSWVKAMNDQPQHQHGFTLKAEGGAASINLADKIYEKWEKFGDRLILYGVNKSAEATSRFSDTLKIVSVTDSMMVLKAANGREIIYTKTADPEKLVSNFETFGCYTYTIKKDSAFLRINITDNVVSGDLEYNNFEKDSNKGTIKGKMLGDTLLADYTFLSEGVTSIREIAMIRKGADFVEGFGEAEETNGKMSFINRSKLNFKKGMVFKKTNCHD